jgi:DNA-binding MarR family transcriptional regulator
MPLIRKLSPLAKRVLNYLQRKGSASPLEVTLDLGVNSGSFTRRVTELRQAGYPITDEWRTHPVTGRQYKRYFYALHS